MAERPVPGPAGTEMRWATLPDGSRVLISVKRGLPQNEVDLLAAQVWQDMPHK